MHESQIVIYQKENGESRIQVKLDKESIWLSQKQMGELFDRDTDTIGLHLKNIYKSKELNKQATTEESSVVQLEGNREVKRRVILYNLDAIISVGYKVNSKKGTLFRIWATKILKEHIIQGFTANKERLKELKKSLELIQSTVELTQIEASETKEIIKVLTDFALGLDILDGYDNQSLEIKEVTIGDTYRIDYEEARKTITQLKQKFGGSSLFGNEKDDSFKGSINAINQTFQGKDLYESIEEKAANLLYFVIKNHSFSDGNKRIAAWIFVWYLNKNKHLYNQQGIPKIKNNTLASLTLMVALSDPEEKDLMIKVIINSINKLNK